MVVMSSRTVVLKYAAYHMIMEQLQLLLYDENLHLKRHMSKCVDCKCKVGSKLIHVHMYYYSNAM